MSSPAAPATWGFRAFAGTLAHHHGNRNWLLQQVDFVNARLDLSDQRLLPLLKLQFAGADVMPAAMADAVRGAILGFRYDLSAPGRDHMCTWTENHQLCFAVCEYLAGQLFPDESFVNDQRTGREHQQAARARLLRWLEDRFHHGFSEWLSPSQREVVVVALTLLVDHAEDLELATRASMVLDLALLEVALHHFQGAFVAAGGRVTKTQKCSPRSTGMSIIVASAFGKPSRFDHAELSAIFVARQRYRVPEVLGEIALSAGGRQIRSSQGRDLAEALADARRAGADEDQLVRIAWGQQGYLSPESVHLTLRALSRLDLEQSRYFAPLTRFRKRVVSTEAARKLLLRTLNPIASGITLHRANIFTYRTPNYLISSVQRYRPGEFGDQQHLWHAALPGDINIFSTHPGATQLGETVREPSPSAWVGNGINPDIAQYNNVVMVLHDLRVRRGYLEGRRHQFSHLYFPFVNFDETKLSLHSVVGRVGTALVGVLALNRMELVSQTELVQRGSLTAWVLVASDLSEFNSLADFGNAVRAATLREARGSLVFTMNHSNTPRGPRVRHEYRLDWKGEFSVDGVVQSPHYWLHDNDWVSAARGSDQILVQGRSSVLRLDWPQGLRVDE